MARRVRENRNSTMTRSGLNKIIDRTRWNDALRLEFNHSPQSLHGVSLLFRCLLGGLQIDDFRSAIVSEGDQLLIHFFGGRPHCVAVDTLNLPQLFAPAVRDFRKAFGDVLIWTLISYNLISAFLQRSVVREKDKPKFVSCL